MKRSGHRISFGGPCIVVALDGIIWPPGSVISAGIARRRSSFCREQERVRWGLPSGLGRGQVGSRCVIESARR